MLVSGSRAAGQKEKPCTVSMQGKRKAPPERGLSAEKLEYIISNVAILGGIPTRSINRIAAPKLAIVGDNLASCLARYIAARCACVVVCGAV